MHRKLKRALYVQQFFPKFFSNYEIIWQNMVQPDRPHTTICALHAASIRLQHTLRLCNVYSLSTPTMVTRTRLNYYVYIHIACLVLILFYPCFPFVSFFISLLLIYTLPSFNSFFVSPFFISSCSHFVPATFMSTTRITR